jgi:hypothetical protein
MTVLVGNSTVNSSIDISFARIGANSTFTMLTANATGIYANSTLVANSIGPYGKTEGSLNVNNATTATSAPNPNAITFNNGGAGAASGSTYTGSATLTVSYNTVGAPSTSGTGASGTWSININGSAASATNASAATNATFATSAGTANTTQALTFASDGTGAAATTTFNGGTARVISYNSVGAPSTSGTNASGTWSININGSAASATNASAATNATTATSATNATTQSTTGSTNFSVGTLVYSANTQGGRTYETHDFNSYPNLYSTIFINPTGSTNVPAGFSGNGYRFIMGAGDTTTRGFDLLGSSAPALWFRAREQGTWNQVVYNSGTWSININGSAASAPNPNAITFNNGGAGAASGSTYTGSSTLTVSYNTVGAPSTTGTNASGTWSISINGSAASATNASAATNATYATSAGSATQATYLNGSVSSATQDNITTRVNSGFWESSTGTLAEGWPTNSNGWHHLLSSTHSNAGNYYAMQLSARFDVQAWYLRNTNGVGTTAWSQIVTNSGTWSININGSAGSATNATYATSAGSAPNPNAVTFNNGGAGAASGSTYTGSATLTVSYNTVGAPSTTGTGASGTWSININGSAASATNASAATNATTATNWGTYGAVPAAGSSGGTASTIPRSDVNGYTYFGYINSSTSNNENPGVSQVIVTNGTDNFYRKSAIANFTTYLSGTASSLTAGAATNASFATNATSATNASYQGPTGTSNDWVTSFQNTPAHYRSFREMSANGPSGTWWFMENMRHSNGSNYWGRQNAWGWEDNANEYYSRNITGGTFGSWVRFLNSSNYNSYAPTLTGTGASGTWSININGSAASATNASAATNATTATNQSGGTVSATTGSFSSDLSFNSGYGSAAVAYGCRVWIRFVVSAGVPAISNDGNVSTITDNGVGNFVINFTTALVDANYAAVANYSETNSATGGGNDGQASCHTYATGSVRIYCARGDGSANDPARCSLIVCR